MTIDTDVKLKVSKARRKARNNRYKKRQKKSIFTSEYLKAKEREDRKEAKRLKKLKEDREYLKMIEERLKYYVPFTVVIEPNT